MDNQNANGGFSPNPNNFPGQFGSYDPNAGQNINNGASAQATNAKEQKSEAQTNDFVVRPLENARTQSLVESPREMSSEELAKAQAYQKELLRQERAYKTKKKAEKAGVYAALGIFGLILVGVVVFVLVGVIGGGYGRGKIIEGGGNEEEQKLSVIDGYQCKTTKCARMDDLPDGRILLRDNDYYVYNKNTQEATLTAIESQDYNSVKTFKWGNKIYAVLDPNTEKSGLFSISDNRMAVTYLYDEFFTDIENTDIYGEMAWVTSQYIIARTASPAQYYVIDLLTGQSVLRGSSKVFMHDGFFIARESNGERRAYLSGSTNAFLVVKSGEKLFTRDGILLYYSETGQLRYFARNGQEVSDYRGTFIEELLRVDSRYIISTIEGNNAYYKIPGN